MDSKIQRLINETFAWHEEKSGHERLWGWFGLSYASFLVLPRIMMHAMPDEWQRRMAVLLEEYDEAFPSHPATDCNVLKRDAGRFVSWPSWLLHYRRPDLSEIERARSP